MPICTTCGGEFEWGYDSSTDKWIMLEPVASHADIDRTFMDENDVMRADHRDRHPGGSSVTVRRMPKKIPAETANEHAKAIVTSIKRRSRRSASPSASASSSVPRSRR